MRPPAPVCVRLSGKRKATACTSMGRCLAFFIERYNWDRPHSSCGGSAPMSRITGANNALTHNI